MRTSLAGGLWPAAAYPETKIPRFAAGLDAVFCSASSLIVPVSGLALAPCCVLQVAGRSTGQIPRASLDLYNIITQVARRRQALCLTAQLEQPFHVEIGIDCLAAG
jgi:hypothetical protein